MSYPKWIERSKDLGPVLATNEQEEQEIIAHFKAQSQAETEIVEEVSEEEIAEPVDEAVVKPRRGRKPAESN